MRQRIALVPAYEPEETLLVLLRSLRENDFETVVVDDGSGAAFDAVFQKAEDFAKVIRYTENRGKGAALKTGFSYIASHFESEDIVVTLDADGQHKVSDALKIADTAAEHPKALVLGGRRFTGDVPLRSRFGNTVTRNVFKLTTGVPVYDTQTGLRAFTVESIPEMLSIEGERYEYEMDVLMYCAREKIPMLEVPIETVYLNDNASSHFNTLKDSARIYKEILKFSAASLASFFVDYVLYSLFLLLLGTLGIANKIVISNVTARLFSATFNFTVNRRIVFQSGEDWRPEAVKYAALALFILLVNTVILTFFTGTLGLHPLLAKIITEVSLFIVSFVIQRTVVFPMKKRSGQKNSAGGNA